MTICGYSDKPPTYIFEFRFSNYFDPQFTGLVQLGARVGANHNIVSFLVTEFATTPPAATVMLFASFLAREIDPVKTNIFPFSG